MSIFGESTSEFRQRRRDAIIGLRTDFFYASWFLLRMQSELLTDNPKCIRYHWQRDHYVWRKLGNLRKPRKIFPKSPKPTISPWKAACRWCEISLPLT